MNKKFYYVFLIGFIVIWGVWYSCNYSEITEKHIAAEKSESISTNEKPAYDYENIPYIININKADAKELEALEGIGEKRAQSIIEYRNEHGPFKSTDELLNVKGIGDVVLGKIKDRISVED
ncbi:MAG: ComEA family DNA-binding protein [Clostridia bacterium]|nr:ComEA family DNA-binding protein [Clostridia bacterium]